MSSFSNFALADDGTLVYVPGSSAPENKLVWVNREGEARPVTNEQRPFGSPRISPDGRRIALDISYDFEGNAALVHNSDRGRELAWPRLPSSDHLAIRHPERRHGVENLAPDPCLNSLCRQPSRSHR